MSKVRVCGGVMETSEPDEDGQVDNLLRCPFCGGKADYIADNMGAWYVQCDDCTMWARPLGHPTMAESRKAWNTRAQSQFGTAELLAIASEMEVWAVYGPEISHLTSEQVRGLAARIRAACSPEAVAFVEARDHVVSMAKAFCSHAEDWLACDLAQRRLWDAVQALAAQGKGK